MKLLTLLTFCSLLSGCAAFEGLLTESDESYGAGALWSEESPSRRLGAKKTPRPTHFSTEIELGMDMDEVLGTWGEPASVSHAGDRSKGNAMWVYPSSGNDLTHGIGGRRVLYFEGGQLAGWETATH